MNRMEKFAQAYKQLNAQQREAVDTIDGPLLVIAGPGTGKTQLLGMRVANILQKTDTDPGNILCLTFTEAAAHNMRERLVALIGEGAYHVAIHTFHSFGSDIIQRYPEYFEDRPLLHPVGELRSYEILYEIFRQLPHADPLSRQIGNDYLHLQATRGAVSWFKQAGIAPDELVAILKQNNKFIDFVEPLIKPVFADIPSAKRMPDYQKIVARVVAFSTKNPANRLSEFFAEELSKAIEASGSKGRHAKEITLWRNRWLIQTKPGEWELLDKRRGDILQAVAGVYKTFQLQLEQEGLYTFDDMIMRTLEGLKIHPQLLLLLQEQYQYILVDEYQDTNGAQNRLLEMLASNPVNEGLPNLMVVGDDDQAIYRFQGANASIMLDFVNRWRDVKQLVLTQNYRSNQQLLDLARFVIKQGSERLENSLPRLSKELKAAKGSRSKTRLKRIQTVSEADQYNYVASEIKRLIDQGADPSEIAVLAPKHSYLQSLVPYLLEHKLPVMYERREHILAQPHIEALTEFAQVIGAAAGGEWQRVDALLPAVLADEYWQLSPQDLWQLSLEAYRKKLSWLELLSRHKQKSFRDISLAITMLSKQSLRAPFEVILEYLVGNQPVILDKNKWHSPYRSYYFSEQRLQNEPGEYLRLIGQLRTLQNAFYEYRSDTKHTLTEFLAFIDLYKRSGITLLDSHPYTTNSSAVQLMTAYRAKGLEWDTVIILGCHNDIWGPKTRSSNYNVGLPANLAWIKPARDSEDDRLRLFYVALTRARSQLYLTYFKQKDNGRATEDISWFSGEAPPLPPLEEQPLTDLPSAIRTQEIGMGWQHLGTNPADLKTILEPELQQYKISATHLNGFFDLMAGGPRNFFFRHILHFPELLRPSAVFGSAMHEVLHMIHTAVAASGRLPSIKKAQAAFLKALDRGSLNAADHARLLERGYRVIELLLSKHNNYFPRDDKSEYDFAHEGVQMGDIRLSGKIDVLRPINKTSYNIIDYKTGVPLENWHPKGVYAQIRAHLYKQQLTFYKLLVENSTSFGSKQVEATQLVFVEPNANGDFITLNHDITTEEVERTKALIQAVWQHIMDLNFPDTSRYSLDLKGVRQLEEDILDGKI